MRHVIVIDSFKGCLSSKEAGEAAARGILRADPSAEVAVYPAADGGEGTLEALPPSFRLVECETIDPLGRSITARYAVRGDEAMIESGEACGLALVRTEERACELMHTGGVGRLIKSAISRGCKVVYVALGGSVTTDGGLGMLREVGAACRDSFGNAVTEGNPLLQTEWISLPQLDVELVLLADVDNPYAGPRGAARVFGPQKGMSPADIERFDEALHRVGRLLGVEDEPGAGAAGGLGGALLALGAQRRSGARFVLEESGALEAIREADIVWTGEGRIDTQTAHGKLPAVVASCARRAIALAGEVTDEAVLEAYSIHERDLPLQQMMDPAYAKERIERTAERIVRGMEVD
ncbi:glycerate kinase family protein [Exiguobacterium flavidum]|uniref:glycerate kinase family protein n=1 Tax=Exiguobacterium flavidum TaxID=2184695 RepID=UPI000DF78823|nr:glycerate kinase [Exiguobacterium flavidum]